MDTFEKKYNEAMLRADEAVQKGCLDKDMFDIIFPPEISEDEQVRKSIVATIEQCPDDFLNPKNRDRMLDWLEKQKEPVLTSIWKDTKDEIAPTKRGILGWYRKADGKLEGRPYIVWFCSEEEASKESEPSVNGTCLAYWAELPNEDFKKTFWCDEPKPAEWSEEDEAMRDNILRLLSCFVGTSEHDSNPSLSTSYQAYQREIDWLKSLRPSWKPSEEQMVKEALEGEVMTNGFYPYEPRIVAPYPNCPYDFGDKVRIIIVKEDL